MNLVVRSKRLRWRELIEDAKGRATRDLALVDLQDPRATTRGACGLRVHGPGLRQGIDPALIVLLRPEGLPSS